jgi:hypothetical protein
MGREPVLDAQSIVESEDDADTVKEEARWDLFFVQLSGLQEYGWHAGLEELMWASDSVNGGLSDLNWDRLRRELQGSCPRWTDAIVAHAQENHAFFQVSENEDETL